MAIDDTTLRVCRAPQARHRDILFDSRQYTAFPHVARLDGDELLLAFRQAPRQDEVRHTHPRSIITVVRSPDRGQTWDIENASQLAAGGGQELGLMYLGGGRVVGALAKHVVVAPAEGDRARIAATHPHEYCYDSVGTYWVSSRDWGLTWRLCDTALILNGYYHPCAPPVQQADGVILCPVYGSRGRDGTSSAVLLRSKDGGVTWSDPFVFARGDRRTRVYHEPAVIELAPGHLRALHRIAATGAGGGPTFWTNSSVDAGRTWSRPVDTGIVSGACPRLLKLTDGRLLLTFGRRAEPFGIRAMLSEDGGITWGDTAWVVRTCRNGNQGYSSSIELAPGEVLTFYYTENARGVTGVASTSWSLP